MAAIITPGSRKEKIRRLLEEGLEKGDTNAVNDVIQDGNYIQHNPQTHEGGEGLAQLFARLAKTNPRVKVVRAFEDGDYVFAQTEYDFSTRRIGFEVFRFDGPYAVEHWDNIQPRPVPELNEGGHSMIDGPTDATDLEKTEENRLLVRNFVQKVFVERQLDQLANYLPEEDERFVQHGRDYTGDGKGAVLAFLQQTVDGSGDDGAEQHPAIRYGTIHRVLAQGDTVLVVTEGHRGVDQHMSFYDLYRVEQGVIVEHWETKEKVPAKSEWKNDNGKF